MLHDTIAKQIPQLARGQVWCRQCGKTRRVDSAEAMRNGWPKCCGCTMTIDSPEERIAVGPARLFAQVPHERRVMFLTFDNATQNNCKKVLDYRLIAHYNNNINSTNEGETK